MHSIATDVLVIGAGGAGMYASIAAARRGCQVTLIDRSLIGRGGATVMAQMTVAVALGEAGPDHWKHHLGDTLKAGRGLCDPDLAQLLCEQGPARIRELDAWGIGWARKEGRITQVFAPGHDRPRCVYVDFLNTGPAVSRTLRAQVKRTGSIRRVGDVLVTDIVVSNGEAVGAVGIHLESGQPVTLKAKSIVIATGGLTRLYRRNSASLNMGGDGYALALRAGAELVNMEFVQFFPIGHLAPRMIGMDPIMWDPFRYKLGGRLLNSQGLEFADRYGASESGNYALTRDVATYAIFKEVEAGRGSPAGGAYLSFTHVPEAQLREAFGPVIDRLAKNGIDLTKMPIEVAPIAHYHMGGVRVDPNMETGVPHLFAAGEAVGGANGANRLSGNALTEAFAFGERAGNSAAARASARSGSGWSDLAGRHATSFLEESTPLGAVPNTAALIVELQALMADNVGPFRTETKLNNALSRLEEMERQIGSVPVKGSHRYDMARVDWLDLRNMILVAKTVVLAASERKESRGAHQREDYPGQLPQWEVVQIHSLQGGRLDLRRAPVTTVAGKAA